VREAQLRVRGPGSPGHGPQWNLTRTIGGRTRAVHLRPGPELEKARREVAEYERFKGPGGAGPEVTEEICAARTVLPGEAGGDSPPRAKGGSAVVSTEPPARASSGSSATPRSRPS
jgi:hypothetical protein